MLQDDRGRAYARPTYAQLEAAGLEPRSFRHPFAAWGLERVKTGDCFAWFLLQAPAIVFLVGLILIGMGFNLWLGWSVLGALALFAVYRVLLWRIGLARRAEWWKADTSRERFRTLIRCPACGGGLGEEIEGDDCTICSACGHAWRALP